jgi:ABC-type sugar transport system substrate-binding protein
MSLNKVIFKGKTLSDLLGEIYDNSAKTRKQLKDLIRELSGLVITSADAQRLVPLIKEYMELGIKNDDQLVKLATIVQRLESAKDGDVGGFNFDELQGLLDESRDLPKSLPPKQDDK